MTWESQEIAVLFCPGSTCISIAVCLDIEQGYRREMSLWSIVLEEVICSVKLREERHLNPKGRRKHTKNAIQTTMSVAPISGAGAIDGTTGRAIRAAMTERTFLFCYVRLLS